MENVINAKRGLFLILVIATMVIFVGLVWFIGTKIPWNLLTTNSPNPTTAGPRVEVNCTFPVPYWMQHPELYPPQMVLGEKVYQAKEISQILSSEPVNLGTRIQAQLMVAFLNNYAGADQAPIETTVFQAYRWLEEHPDGSQVHARELEAGNSLYDALMAYNHGLSGVPICRGASIFILTETSMIPGAESTHPTVSPSPTGTPTGTGTATYTPASASQTATRTIAPPVLQPTNTKSEPTSAPIDTQPPVVIPTNTTEPILIPTDTPSGEATVTPPPEPTQKPTQPPS